jgi:PAS domain S-box-containing protein
MMAENETARNEKRLEEAQRIAQIGDWDWDPAADTVTWSEQLYRIFSLDPNKPPPDYKGQLQLYHPEDSVQLNEAVSKALKDGTPYELELRRTNPDGQVIHLLARGETETDQSGTVTRLYGSVQDITDRKNTEEALVKSKAQLRILVDTIPDLVWLKDPDGVYLGCNPKFERFFGEQESAIIGKTDYDFVERELADFFRVHDQKAIERDTTSINEELLTFSDDGYHGIFETMKTPMRDPNGNLIGVLGVARDITERKKVENDLLQSEQRYKSAQRIGLVGNWEYDLVSNTFWGSEQAKRIYGFEPDSDLFTTDQVEHCIPERERVHQALVDLIEKNTPYNLEFEINPLSGSNTRVVRSIAELSRDKKGNPLKVIGVIQDITSQKEAEKERKKLERHLIQTQKMESIGYLAGGIAHDFNNILTSILGFSELALDEVEKGSTMEDNLQEIYAGGVRAKEIVKQILAFARQSEEDVKPIRVSTIITEALKLIRPSTPATIEIRQEIESSSLVLANTTHIHQIIMNLCTNAAHAMRDDGGTMEVILKDVFFDEGSNITAGLNKGKYIELIVSDTGCGIEPEHIDSIFDPYFTTKDAGEGTGMGLAMVRGIVDSYGGSITVESTPSRKTAFTIHLPITSNLNNEINYEAKTLPKGDEHILFVDDEPPIARMGSRILERLGYQVTTRTSSIEALELFKAKSGDFHLVITDMTMPHMTGDKFAIELKKIRANIPIILCTGYSNKINAEIAKEIGINAFTYKPVSKADLARAVRGVLDKT